MQSLNFHRSVSQRRRPSFCRQGAVHAVPLAGTLSARGPGRYITCVEFEATDLAVLCELGSEGRPQLYPETVLPPWHLMAPCLWLCHGALQVLPRSEANLGVSAASSGAHGQQAARTDLSIRASDRGRVGSEMEPRPPRWHRPPLQGRGEDVGTGAVAGAQERCSAPLSPAPCVGPHWHHLPVAVLSPLPCDLSHVLTVQQAGSWTVCRPAASAQAYLHLRPQGCLLVILSSCQARLPAWCQPRWRGNCR